MEPYRLFIWKHRITHNWYAYVRFPNGKRSKVHYVFKSSEQAEKFMRYMYRLPKEAKVIIPDDSDWLRELLSE